MKSKFCSNNLFVLGMIVLLMSLISACTPGNSTTAAGDSYSISGVVTINPAVRAASAGILGVTVTLGGDGTGETTTDGSGNYSFTGLANGTYTITPSGGGYIFTDVSTVKVVNGASVPDADFQAIDTGTTYIISGRVTLEDGTSSFGVTNGANAVCVKSGIQSTCAPSGVGLAGVLITLSDGATGTTITDGNGNYSLPGVVAPGNYTVTPSKTGYTFQCPSAGYEDHSDVSLSGNSLGNDFTATPALFRQSIKQELVRQQ